MLRKVWVTLVASVCATGCVIGSGWFQCALSAELPSSDDSRQARGNPDAPVTIVEYSDFQCPSCQRVYPVLKEVLMKYKDQVKLVYKDLPIRTIHPNAELAATAARCAGEQSKFWEYHDALFEAAGDLTRASLMRRAERLALDTKVFEACLASEKFKDAIEEDFQEGIRLGVTGTPAFFINGTRLIGVQPVAVFELKIREALEAVQRKSVSP